MATSSNFKNFQSTVNQLVVNRSIVSSRFKLKSASAKVRMLKSVVSTEIFPTTDEETLPNIELHVDSLLQATVGYEEQPIACPVPTLSDFDVAEHKISKKESWLTQLFSLKPKAL